MGSKPTGENGSTSQIEQSKPVDLNMKSENSQIQCEETTEDATEAESNVAVDSGDFGEASGGRKLQRDHEIRRAMTSIPKFNGVKATKRNYWPLPRKPIKKKSQSFGSYVDTHMRKITNQKHREKTERDILRLLFDRIENESVKFKNS